MRRITRTAITLTATGCMIAGMTVAAYADTGDRTRTKSLGSWAIRDAQGHVAGQVKSASVTWGKNIFDGSEWATVKITFRDARTDGACARATLATYIEDTVDPGSIIPTPKQRLDVKECNAVYVTKSKTFNTKGQHVNAAGVFITRGGVQEVHSFIRPSF